MAQPDERIRRIGRILLLTVLEPGPLEDTAGQRADQRFPQRCRQGLQRNSRTTGPRSGRSAPSADADRGSFLGYERVAINCPKLIAALLRWGHRGTLLAAWEDVARLSADHDTLRPGHTRYSAALRTHRS